MAVDSKRASGFLALSRFGYGARGSADDLARAASDPRAFLKAELETPGISLLQRPNLPTTKTALQALYAEQERIQLARQEKKATEATEPAKPAPSGETMSAPDAQKSPDAKAMRTEPPVPQQLFRADALARFQTIAAAEAGFVERLVQFWSNHFCISAAKGGRRSRHRRMLRARGDPAACARSLCRHAAAPSPVIRPCWSISTMPSRSGLAPLAGQRRKSGLNENLAREILELHTLGVAGGYTQADVTSLARILTGWTFAGREGRIAEPGDVRLLPQRSRARRHIACSARSTRPAASSRARPRWPISHAIRRRPGTLRASSRAHFVADEPPHEPRRSARPHVREDRRRSEGDGADPARSG